AELLPVSDWPKVALIAGLSVCHALEQTVRTAAVRVKWPNDVYLNGRKISGILSESIPGRRDRIVVGVGVNVNNSVRDDLGLGSAVSLIEHDGVFRDLTEVLLTVLDEFARRWRELID